MEFTEEPRPYTMTTLGSSVTLSCAGTASLENADSVVSWLFTREVSPEIGLARNTDRFMITIDIVIIDNGCIKFGLSAIKYDERMRHASS